MVFFPSLVVVVVVVSVLSKHQSSFEQQSDSEYDTVTVEYIGKPQRYKRSIELPQTMIFHLKSEKTDVKLRLRRAPRNDIPTYICNNGYIQQIYIQDYQSSGVFVNQQTGYAMMVSDRGGYFNLNGNVIVDSNTMTLQPQSNGKHLLTSAMMISYGADELMGLQTGVPSLYEMQTAMEYRSRRRYKRASKSYAVELLVVTDYTIKERFLARNGGSDELANSEIKAYYSFVILGMSQRYKTISNFYPETIISIEGSGIVISNSDSDAPYHQASNKNGILEYITALSEFTDWVSENTEKNNLPPHDHAMWFTDDQLASGKSTSVIGVAWVGTMCTKNSTSIVEEYFTGRTEQIAAHELGHSLYAVHDGDVKGCSNDDAYVMSAASYFPDDDRRTHPWIFSECSALYMAYYAPHFTCLSSGDSGSSFPASNEYPGQYLNADEQCKIFQANYKSYFCRSEQLNSFGFNLMCQRMYCYNPSSSSCQTVIAKDYTSCGNGKWCDGGDCIWSASAPARSDNCPQGDSNEAMCNSASCSVYDANQLINCCATCVGYIVVDTKSNNKAAVNSLEGNVEQCPSWDTNCIYCRSSNKRKKDKRCDFYR